MNTIAMIDRLNEFLERQRPGCLIEEFSSRYGAIAVCVRSGDQEIVRRVLLTHLIDGDEDMCQIHFLENRLMNGDWCLGDLESVTMTLNYPAVLSVLYGGLPPLMVMQKKQYRVRDPKAVYDIYEVRLSAESEEDARVIAMSAMCGSPVGVDDEVLEQFFADLIVDSIHES